MGKIFSFVITEKKKKEKISKCCLSNLVFLKINFSKNLSPLIIRWSKLDAINHGAVCVGGLDEVSTLNGRPSTPFSKPQSVAGEDEQFSNSWRGSLENCRKSPFWPSLIDVDGAILPRHLAVTSFRYSTIQDTWKKENCVVQFCNTMVDSDIS